MPHGRHKDHTGSKDFIAHHSARLSNEKHEQLRQIIASSSTNPTLNSFLTESARPRQNYGDRVFERFSLCLAPAVPVDFSQPQRPPSLSHHTCYRHAWKPRLLYLTVTTDEDVAFLCLLWGCCHGHGCMPGKHCGKPCAVGLISISDPEGYSVLAQSCISRTQHS